MTPTSRSGTAGLGVVLYLIGVGLFSINDALGKWLVADYGVGQLMMLRSIGAAVVLAPIVVALRVNLIDARQAPLQVLRIVCSAVDTFSFYYATRFMPLADVMTFYMATPLIVTALSAPLLGEKVERFRWIAVVIGFGGVVIALRPSPQMFSWAAPLALFGATMFALSQTITRQLRRTHWLPLVLLAIRRQRRHRRSDRSMGLDDAVAIRCRPHVPGRRRFDDLLHLHHQGAGARSRRRARAPAIFRDPLGGDHGLARLARRSDAPDHCRQCGHHRQRTIRRDRGHGRRGIAAFVRRRGRTRAPSWPRADTREQDEPLLRTDAANRMHCPSP